MQNLYNAKVSFKGEGSFTFTMPYYGEVTIYPRKDIYMKNLTQQGVETLRTLRPMLLDHKLNAKPDGCYTYIDFNESIQNIPTRMSQNYNVPQQTKTVAQMKSEMIKGPIIDEEAVVNTQATETILEPVKDEEAINPETTNPADYVLTSSKHKGRRIGDLTRGQISGNMNRFNEEDLTAIKKYLNK